MNSCCKNNIKTKKCKRKDGKVFDIPRKFSKKNTRQLLRVGSLYP